MSAFEYVFAFYSLILGLAAAEVVSGFADMWRDRRRMEVGFCTPVLALCVLLGIMNTWITFWAYREILAVGAEFMLVTALTALPYVFIARLMFPREGQGVSLEEHLRRSPGGRDRTLRSKGRGQDRPGAVSGSGTAPSFGWSRGRNESASIRDRPYNRDLVRHQTPGPSAGHASERLGIVYSGKAS